MASCSCCTCICSWRSESATAALSGGPEFALLVWPQTLPENKKTTKRIAIDKNWWIEFFNRISGPSLRRRDFVGDGSLIRFRCVFRALTQWNANLESRIAFSGIGERNGGAVVFQYLLDNGQTQTGAVFFPVTHKRLEYFVANALRNAPAIVANRNLHAAWYLPQT